MKREQIEKGKILIDKLDALDRSLSSLSNTLNESTGITLSASFTSKFKDELMVWMESLKTKLEKELEEL